MASPRSTPTSPPKANSDSSTTCNAAATKQTSTSKHTRAHPSRPTATSPDHLSRNEYALTLTPLGRGTRRSPSPTTRATIRLENPAPELLHRVTTTRPTDDHRRSDPEQQETRLTSGNRSIRRVLRKNGAEGTRTPDPHAARMAHKGLPP